METKCRITKIVFNDKTEMTIGYNDIVIFVGANNSGKSQSLKDIDNAFINSAHNVVVQRIEFENIGTDKFEESLKEVSAFNKKDNAYSGYGYLIHSAWLRSLGKDTFNGFEQIKTFFIKQLSTRDRLNQCNPIGVIDRDAPKLHPLHYLASNPELRTKINNSFYEAFGQHLQVERYGGQNNFLRLGEEIARLPGENISFDQDIDNVTKVMDTYPKLHEQGDGMVSFTGVLLSLLIEHYSVFLIDEPESFLHPPQARILGTEIPDLLGERQAFISTHSEHLLKGLLEVAQDRIKVVRITRKGNENSFSIINTEDISKIWKDTLLRQSNVLQGLFYDAVVICESDSDCQFYSAIQTHIKEKLSKRDNTFFVYSSTKNRMKVIVDALRPLNVDYRVIADLDLLREENDIKSLYVSCGGKWEDIADVFSKFSLALKDEKNTISKDDLKACFVDLIEKNGKEEYDKTSLQELKRRVTLDKKWAALKKDGIKAIPGEAKEAFGIIDGLLKQANIFLVPNGELEGFVAASGHGPSWVANVMGQYPDYADEIYADARQFVSSWRL